MIQKAVTKKVARCKYCKILITNAGIVLIKGKRQFTCPQTGKEKCHVANVYLHYLRSCLKGYDGKSRFERVAALKETIIRWPESAGERFTKQNLQIQK